MSRRVLVTGAAGYVGSEIVRGLAPQADFEVVGVWRTRPPSLPAGKGLSLIQADLTDREQVASLFGPHRIDAVVNAAAGLASGVDPESVPGLIADNIAVQANLVAEAAARDCRRFVFLSTISVFGRNDSGGRGLTETDRPAPASHYAWTKLAAEHLLEVSARAGVIDTAVTLRLPGVHGGRRPDGVVRTMIDRARAGRPIRVEHPGRRLQVVFVQDAVRAVESALTADLAPGYHCFHVAGEEVFGLEDLARLILVMTGSSSSIEIGAGNRIDRRFFDTTRAKAGLGFVAAPLADNLKRMIERQDQTLRGSGS